MCDNIEIVEDVVGTIAEAIHSATVVQRPGVLAVAVLESVQQARSSDASARAIGLQDSIYVPMSCGCERRRIQNCDLVLCHARNFTGWTTYDRNQG